MPTLTDIGRIGRDAELRYTASGDAVCNLAIACDYGRKGQDGRRPVQWVDATLWGKQAEAMAQYLVKGQQVHFTIDDAHVEVFTKSDQTQGVKLTGRVIIIKFAGSPPQQSQGNQPAQQPRQQRPAPQPSQQGVPPDAFDDDIPFAPIPHLAGA
ncbi:Helix-destabilizing protein [Pseudomonas putida]|uniref:single-stranded DNA-binding protein n=1 Tax=Pseudomonas sp. HTZ2 TaxID=3075220 RepID=UPI001F95A093|nr:single-stranded DNA-binding protein [Pseudomonas sp. HTZ2]CAB5577309.1 Helix-destabilizing protein [Pseudomonas putida]CAB5578138.1 Helix-destabilizing protein [Pseudomonas putida]CAB5620824.1 Helix-destabilizing protein [Pseudomonas putida]CAB5622326.1 Helix-destabilizing protein [Pseudomonas putida]CAB5702536.1 Helix-destabilizing protein [Pseudomonas putida]